MVYPGRWVRLLLAALDAEPAVGVRRVLEQHVRREPTRAELSAVRRAAHALQAAGLAEVVHLGRGRLRTERGDGYLVVVRPGVAVEDEALRAAVAPTRADSAGETAVLGLATGLVTAVQDQAGRAPQVAPERLDAASAARLGEELGSALRDLERLRRQLVRRGRQGEPV